ncbi:MAG: DNA recombination protein RmuC, partial [Maribacter sp.]
MNEIYINILLGIVFLSIGYISGYYIQGLKTKSKQSALQEREQQMHNNLSVLQQRVSEKDAKIVGLQAEKEQLNHQLIRADADMDNLLQRNKEQKAEVEALQEKFTKEFENLANRILEEKSLKFTERNEKNIKDILSPLNEKIQLFEKKVEESQKENISIHSALREQLLNLQTQNSKITQEAENLTKALKGDSKMQGNWGELVLERVLEKSGLEKDREYSVQQSFERADGSRVLPDVIIHLPNRKKMIVDSKVSLTDYERYINGDEELRSTYLKNHMNSLRRHVD